MDSHNTGGSPIQPPTLRGAKKKEDAKLYEAISAADFTRAKRSQLIFMVAFPTVIVGGFAVLWILANLIPYEGNGLHGAILVGYGALVSAGMTNLWKRGAGLLKTRAYIDFAQAQKLESYRRGKGE